MRKALLATVITGALVLVGAGCSSGATITILLNSLLAILQVTVASVQTTCAANHAQCLTDAQVVAINEWAATGADTTQKIAAILQMKEAPVKEAIDIADEINSFLGHAPVAEPAVIQADIAAATALARQIQAIYEAAKNSGTVSTLALARLSPDAKATLKVPQMGFFERRRLAGVQHRAEVMAHSLHREAPVR